MEAELLAFPLRHPKSRTTVAQRAGLRYETKAFLHLIFRLDHEVMCHPAFKFSNHTHLTEYAIPDAIYISKNTLTIFEIKLRHTADAWHQLNKLYLPILQKAYPAMHINLCEVCRYYDPTVKLQGSTTLLDDVVQFASAPQQSYGIYIWNGN